MLSSVIRRFVGSPQPSELSSTRDSFTKEELEGDSLAEVAEMDTGGEKTRKSRKSKKRKGLEEMELGVAGGGEKEADTGAMNGASDANLDGDASMQMNADGDRDTAGKLKEKEKKTKRKNKKGLKGMDFSRADEDVSPDFEPEITVSARPSNGLKSSDDVASAKKHKKHKKSQKSTGEDEAAQEAERVAADDNEVSPANRQPQRELEEYEGSTPTHPPKAALGKRKATEPLHNSTQKTKRKRKSKDALSQDLTTLGFTSSSRLDSEQVSSTREPLQAFAEGLYIESSREYHNPPPILPPGMSRAHRPTPTFTPVNSRRSPSNEPSKDHQIHAPSPKDSPSQYPPSPPKSNQKRKRRLPVDEPESPNSNAEAVSGDPTKGSGKTPKKKAVTPKPKAPAKKSGRLTPEEIEAIATAVEMYRDANRMTQYEINTLIQDAKGGSPVRIELFKYIFEQVPGIHTSRVRDVCRRRFHNYTRGSWTADEDEELRDAVERFPGKWTDIGPLVNRLPEDARDRWRNYLVCGDNLKTHMWTREEEDQLRDVVAESLEQIRNNRKEPGDPGHKDNDEELMNWASISSKMGLSRSRLQCRAKWIALREREAEGIPDPAEDKEAVETEWRLNEAKRGTIAMRPADKLNFLYAVRNSGAGRESKIPWKIVCAELGQKKGQRMIYKFCFKHLRRKVPEYKDLEFKDCLDRIIHRFEEVAPAEPQEFIYTGKVPEILRRNRKKKGEDFTEEELLTQRERKHVRIKPHSDGDNKISRKRKKKGGTKDDTIKPDGDEASGPHKKRIRKEKQQPLSEEFVFEGTGEEGQNSDHSATAEYLESRLEETGANLAQPPADSENITPKQKRKKFRDRMKQHGDTQSQESEDEARGLALDMGDDIGSAMQSLKKAHKTSRKSRKKASMNNTANDQSDSSVQPEKGWNSSQVLDQEDNDTHLAETSSPSDEGYPSEDRRLENDDEQPRSGSEVDDETSGNGDGETRTSAADLETSSVSSNSSQAEESVSVGYYAGSIDLGDDSSADEEDKDADGVRTPNEFNRRRSSLSPDLDTPVKYDGRRHNTKPSSSSLSSDEGQDEQGDMDEDGRASSITPALSDSSSSDGSIPARVEQREDSTSEDDDEDDRLRGVSVEL